MGEHDIYQEATEEHINFPHVNVIEQPIHFDDEEETEKRTEEDTDEGMETEEKSFDFYDCQVCFNSLLQRKPRLLCCGHTFCQNCLSEVIYRERVVCPKCRTITQATRVDSLPVNIDIRKVREREMHIVLSPNVICRKCFLDYYSTKTATWRCLDCDSNFCDPCVKHHDSLKIFKSHCIEPLHVKIINQGSVPLCQSHGYELAYICMDCCQAACKDCALETRHEAHGEKITEFQRGLVDVKTAAKELLQETRQACRSFESFLKSCQSRKFSFDKLYDITHSRATDLEEALNETSEYDFVSAYCKIKKDVRENLDWIEQIISRSADDFLTGNIDTLIVPAEASLIPLSDPKQMLSLSPGQGVQIRLPAELAVSDDGDGFYVDNWVSYVQRIDKEGNLLRAYHPHSHVDSQINDADVYGDYLYIGQRTGISVIPLEYTSEDEIRVYRPNTPRITTFRVYDETMLVVADHTVGRVVTYEPLQDKTTIVARGLDEPQFVGIIRAIDGAKFTVTECAPGRIRIYNQNWELINTILGEGDSPNLGATLVTPGGSLLVADTENNRISEYTCSGQLMRHILTQENGLYRPNSLAYRHPWLWFTEVDYFDTHMALKLFNLKPDTHGQ